MMEERRLGRTGLSVAVVGLGTIGFKKDDPDAVWIVRRALDEGVNIIDTAHAYGAGRAERIVGEALEGRRSSCAVLTRSVSREPDALLADVDESLRNLRTDYIDIYQLHDMTRPDDVAKVAELLGVLTKARDQGKVRFIGVSTHAAAADVRAMIATGEIDVLTIAYNITRHKRSVGDGEDMARVPDEVLPFAREHDVGVTVMKPLGGGVLARRSPTGEPGVPPAKAIRYVVENPLVSAVTPGVGSVSELLEDLSAADPASALSPEEMRALEEQGRRWGRDFCRQCGYCLPCEQEIEIPRMMSLWSQLQSKEADPESMKRDSYDKLGARADECIECGACEERCPYELPIMERIREVGDKLG